MIIESNVTNTVFSFLACDSVIDVVLYVRSTFNLSVAELKNCYKNVKQFNKSMTKKVAEIVSFQSLSSLSLLAKTSLQ